MKAKTTLECAPDNNPTIKVGLELMVKYHNIFSHAVRFILFGKTGFYKKKKF